MFKKLFSLFAALTLSVGLWAIDNVAYIDANGQPKTANGVNEITNASATLAEGWYVVKGEDVKTGELVCNGAVNLILADGAKLTATGANNQAGIRVSDSNSLTIYAQSTGTQMGQLIANGNDASAGIGGGMAGSGSNITINGGIITANGGMYAAGIGGGMMSSGSNITINGGMVTATGGEWAAGIGGGNAGDGSNITINGGIVTATGADGTTGIGGGMSGSSSNIFVATKCIVKAGDTENPTEVIAATRTATTDIANDLAGKQYVTVETPAGPVEGDQFEDATSGLYFVVTAVGETNTVNVIKNVETPYSGTTYTIPDTVTYNGVDFAVTEIFGAFENCENLESITLPTTLTTIGMFAFSGCTSLQSITLPEGLTEIGEYAFSGCSSLQSITLPTNLTTIGASAFSLCTGLQSITIPASVATIGACAFIQRNIPSPPTIPARVATIGKRASQNSSSLTSVTFLGNACQDAIGNNAFYGVGETTPALLTLPNNWTGGKPDEEGNWYGGKFELSSDPTALPTLFGDDVKGNKFLYNGQVIIRKDGKTYSILGNEL